MGSLYTLCVPPLLFECQRLFYFAPGIHRDRSRPVCVRCTYLIRGDSRVQVALTYTYMRGVCCAWHEQLSGSSPFKYICCIFIFTLSIMSSSPATHPLTQHTYAYYTVEFPVNYSLYSSTPLHQTFNDVLCQRATAKRIPPPPQTLNNHLRFIALPNKSNEWCA